jgi:hypothetical protein
MTIRPGNFTGFNPRFIGYLPGSNELPCPGRAHRYIFASSNNKQPKSMKATTTILAVILTFSMNVLFASNDKTAVNSESNSVHVLLAPVTPSEATFEEISDAASIAFILAPVSPIEADFSDAIAETTIDNVTLAPVTPSEADFGSDDETTNVSVFAPVTPSVADFSDGI